METLQQSPRGINQVRCYTDKTKQKRYQDHSTECVFIVHLWITDVLMPTQSSSNFSFFIYLFCPLSERFPEMLLHGNHYTKSRPSFSTTRVLGIRPSLHEHVYLRRKRKRKEKNPSCVSSHTKTALFGFSKWIVTKTLRKSTSVTTISRWWNLLQCSSKVC